MGADGTRDLFGNRHNHCYTSPAYRARVEIIDRKEAIRYAIRHGESGDIIVLAGKGHEDYQIIKGKKYPIDRKSVV